MQKAAASCQTFCISESSLRSPTQDCSSRIHVRKMPKEKTPGCRMMVKGTQPEKASGESTRLSCERGRTLSISCDSSKLNHSAGFCIAALIRHHFCKPSLTRGSCTWRASPCYVTAFPPVSSTVHILLGDHPQPWWRLQLLSDSDTLLITKRSFFLMYREQFSQCNSEQ